MKAYGTQLRAAVLKERECLYQSAGDTYCVRLLNEPRAYDWRTRARARARGDDSTACFKIECKHRNHQS